MVHETAVTAGQPTAVSVAVCPLSRPKGSDEGEQSVRVRVTEVQGLGQQLEGVGILTADRATERPPPPRDSFADNQNRPWAAASDAARCRLEPQFSRCP
jgi:hypothetical protein